MRGCSAAYVSTIKRNAAARRGFRGNRKTTCLTIEAMKARRHLVVRSVAFPRRPIAVTTLGDRRASANALTHLRHYNTTTRRDRPRRMGCWSWVRLGWRTVIWRWSSRTCQRRRRSLLPTRRCRPAPGSRAAVVAVLVLNCPVSIVVLSDRTQSASVLTPDGIYRDTP